MVFMGRVTHSCQHSAINPHSVTNTNHEHRHTFYGRRRGLSLKAGRREREG